MGQQTEEGFGISDVDFDSSDSPWEDLDTDELSFSDHNTDIPHVDTSDILSESSSFSPLKLMLLGLIVFILAGLITYQILLFTSALNFKSPIKIAEQFFESQHVSTLTPQVEKIVVVNSKVNDVQNSFVGTNASSPLTPLPLAISDVVDSKSPNKSVESEIPKDAEEITASAVPIIKESDLSAPAVEDDLSAKTSTNFDTSSSETTLVQKDDESNSQDALDRIIDDAATQNQSIDLNIAALDEKILQNNDENEGSSKAKKLEITQSTDASLAVRPKQKPAYHNKVTWYIHSAQPGKALIYNPVTEETRHVAVGDSVEKIGQIVKIKRVRDHWKIFGLKGLIQEAQ